MWAISEENKALLRGAGFIERVGGTRGALIGKSISPRGRSRPGIELGDLYSQFVGRLHRLSRLGHLEDEFFRGRDWDTFEEFKADLEAYIRHWNNTRRQVQLGGLTPVEYRDQALGDAA